jgi:tetratricopeptide (TPR) repeat protein
VKPNATIPPLAASQGRTRRRRWLFRVAAVMLGLSPFAAFELLCRAVGWGADDPGVDPFVGFASIRPLFELTEDGNAFHTAPARRGFFKEDSFAARKPAGEFRIFVFGGSTVQGNPFSIETSFPSWLRIALEQAAPERLWEVVNCGGVSYASYRLVPVMQECLRYEPDLFIFCGGHNEFLEDVEYASQRAMPGWLQRSVHAAGQLRTIRLLQSLATRRVDTGTNVTEAGNSLAQRPTLPAEVSALLNFDGGLAAYVRDDEHAAHVAAHFRSNLERMAMLTQPAGVSLLFILPPSNLSDCPPFKSVPTPGLTSEQELEVASMVTAARTASRERPAEAVALYEQAARLDPRNAFVWYELGQHQRATGDFAAAESSFRRARDEDVCPLRMISPLEQTMRDVAAEAGVPLIDAHALLAAASPNGIPDGSVLVDHVHPSFRGHEDIAIAIAEWMIESGCVESAASGWQQRTRSECERVVQSLGDLYFLRGRRALESLREWAAGRSGGPPLPGQPK